MNEDWPKEEWAKYVKVSDETFIAVGIVLGILGLVLFLWGVSS